MVSPPMTAATPNTPGENGGKPKLKPQQYHVIYENPDLKVVVRLLPPLLTQDQFFIQLDQKGVFSQGSTPYTSFYYEPGSRQVKAFEEPVFSRAYFQFPSKQLADSYMSEFNNLSFEEPDTGDLFMCKTMRSVFGAVGGALDASPLADFASDPLFSRYLRAREEEGKIVSIVDVKQELEAEEKRKRLALKKKEKLKDKKKKQKTKKEQEDNTNDKPNEGEAPGPGNAKKKKRPRKNKGGGPGGAAVGGAGDGGGENTPAVVEPSSGSTAPNGGKPKKKTAKHKAGDANENKPTDQNNVNVPKKKKKPKKTDNAGDQKTKGPDASGDSKRKEGLTQKKKHKEKKTKEKKDNQTDKVVKSEKPEKSEKPDKSEKPAKNQLNVKTENGLHLK